MNEHGELIDWIKNRAIEFRRLTPASSSSVSQDDIDELLVWFINFCAAHQGIDYGMIPCDFSDEKSRIYDQYYDNE